MRANLLAFAVAAFTVVAAASCGDGDTTPGNDAGLGMDSGVVTDGGVPPVDTGTPPGDAHIDAITATCSNVGDVCTDLACCAPSVCVDHVITSLCEVPVEDGGMCASEGSPCFLGTACCPGTFCMPGVAVGLICSVEGAPDAAITCGRLGSPCDLAICCPGLVCAMRGPGMFCLDRA